MASANKTKLVMTATTTTRMHERLRICNMWRLTSASGSKNATTAMRLRSMRTTECQLPRCGDGSRKSANLATTVTGQYRRLFQRLPRARCGDGLINAVGEVCDDGTARQTVPTAASKPAAEMVFCGLALKRAMLAKPMVGMTATRIGLSTRGDGVVQVGEECDDGNRSNGDDCTNRCLRSLGGNHPGW